MNKLITFVLASAFAFGAFADTNTTAPSNTAPTLQVEEVTPEEAAKIQDDAANIQDDTQKIKDEAGKAKSNVKK